MSDAIKEVIKGLEEATECQPSPAMMPPEHIVEEMAEAYENTITGPGPSPTIDCMRQALSCDAFRKWLGGVGDSDKQAALQDLAYVNGAKAGWNAALSKDDEYAGDHKAAMENRMANAVAVLANIKTEG